MCTRVFKLSKKLTDVAIFRQSTNLLSRTSTSMRTNTFCTPGSAVTQNNQYDQLSHEEPLKSEVYDKALEHWMSISSDVDGMLGGFAQLHAPDVSSSRQFIHSLKKAKILLNNGRALDCGSGIGRVTKHLLLPLFRKVDMVDFAENFLENSRSYIGEEGFNRIGNQFVESLHVFVPEPNTYDVIWIQWVTGHLTDSDFRNFLRRCKIALKKGGCIVIKDNICKGSLKEFDTEDHSWTRPRQEFYSTFRKSGLKVVVDRKQLNFPNGIYEVRMFALIPHDNMDQIHSNSSTTSDESNEGDNDEDDSDADENILNDRIKNVAIHGRQSIVK